MERPLRLAWSHLSVLLSTSLLLWVAASCGPEEAETGGAAAGSAGSGWGGGLGGASPDASHGGQAGEFVAECPVPKTSQGQGGEDFDGPYCDTSWYKDPEATPVRNADVVQVHDNKLFSLSEYDGLKVVDLTDPSHPVIIGQQRLSGVPSAMHLHEGLLIATHHEYSQRRNRSRITALDVHDPANIIEVTSIEVPQRVGDTRVLGDVLYVAANGWHPCWGSGKADSITSYKLSAPISMSESQRLDLEWGDHLAVMTEEHVFLMTDTALEVIDTRDPSGSMVRGPQVEVKYRLKHEWQMDEWQGVLRIANQDADGRIVVQTFQITPDLQLIPQAELTTGVGPLLAARFDGTRVYVVGGSSSGKTLTAIDLSDPALPVEGAPLQIAGSADLVGSTGNLLFNLVSSPDGVSLSMADMADISNPEALAELVIDSTSYEHADLFRTRQGIRVNAAGLIAVPLGKPAAGTSRVQLVDAGNGLLTLRGAAQVPGPAHRTVMRGEQLLAVSEDRITALDISGPDSPTQTGKAEVPNVSLNVKVIGGAVVMVANDRWTGSPSLITSPVPVTIVHEPLATLPMGFRPARWLSSGETLYAIGGQGEVGIFTLLDPAKPTLLSQSLFARPYLSGNVVLRGTTVATMNGFDLREVNLLDLSKPAAPVLASTVALPPGIQHSGPVFDGDSVITARAEQVPGQAPQCKHYLDRWGVSDLRFPERLPSVNVAGALLRYDSATQRALTLHRANNADVLSLVQMSPDRAEVLASIQFDGADQLTRWVASAGDSVFVETFPVAHASTTPVTVQLLTGMAQGTLQAKAEVPVDGPGGMFAIDGSRLLFHTANKLSVYEATDASTLSLVSSVRLPGPVSGIEVEGDTAYCSLGPLGVKAVALGKQAEP